MSQFVLEKNQYLRVVDESLLKLSAQKGRFK